MVIFVQQLNVYGSSLTDIKFHYKSAMNDIKEESCGALKMGLRHAICGLAIGEGEIVFALDASNKRLLGFTLPEPDKKLKKVIVIIENACTYNLIIWYNTCQHI